MLQKKRKHGHSTGQLTEKDTCAGKYVDIKHFGSENDSIESE